MIKKIEIHNKKAKFSYEIKHTLTAGIQLNGTEIKSIRNNEANIKDIEQVLKKKSAKKIDGMYMDMTTANAIMTVYKALGQSNKKKFAKLPLKKMVSVAWKLVK